MTTENSTGMKHLLNPIHIALQLTIIALLAVLVWRQFTPGLPVDPETDYVAILLSNGQHYYGRITHDGPEVVTLDDVHYIKSTVDQKTGQESKVLSRRDKELHAPARMYIRAEQVLIVEPVTPSSAVGRMVERMSSQAGK